MESIVVTGAAGFIGSHLCEFLLGKGNKVIGIDNFATGRMVNIEQFFSNGNFKFIEHELNWNH